MQEVKLHLQILKLRIKMLAGPKISKTKEVCLKQVVANEMAPATVPAAGAKRASESESEGEDAGAKRAKALFGEAKI